MHGLLPIVVLIIFAIVRAVANASKQSGDAPTSRSRPRPTPTESEEERMRRFMEAVGLPPGSTPPPPIRPRTTAASPPPLLPVKPPGATIYDPGRLRRAPSPPPARTQTVTRSIPRTTPPPVVMPPAPMVAQMPPISQVAAIPGARPVSPVPPPATGAPAKPVAIPASQLLLRLRDPAAIREAVILREVLGPPRAFHPLELASLGR